MMTYKFNFYTLSDLKNIYNDTGFILINDCFKTYRFNLLTIRDLKYKDGCITFKYYHNTIKIFSNYPLIYSDLYNFYIFLFSQITFYTCDIFKYIK